MGEKTAKAMQAWSSFSYSAITRVTPVVVWGVGMAVVVTRLTSFHEDTTSVTNSAFAGLATLSALSFSGARAITSPDDHHDAFLYAGERFLHAAILALTASAIKYAYIGAESRWLGWWGTTVAEIVGIVPGILVTILFIYSLSSAHGGMSVLNKVLWLRLNRRPEWDQF